MPPPDLAVHGGTIHSLDAAAPRPAVLLVRRGRVAALGGPELLAGVSAARRLDLHGRTVVPGLIDAHAHFLALGAVREEVDLGGCVGLEAVAARMAAAARELPAGAFVLGHGWNEERWPGGERPHHRPLSAAAPEHLVRLRRADGHALLVNERLLHASGIDRDRRDPRGGRIERDCEGRPTGVLVDAAMGLAVAPPPPDEAVLRRHALAAQHACLAAGLTGVHDAGVGERELGVLRQLAAAGDLHLRLDVMLAAGAAPEAGPSPWLARRLAAGPTVDAGGRLSVRAVKVFADGSLGSRGAALSRPYADDPGTRGLRMLRRDGLARLARECAAAGFQLAVHAIGDAAARLVLEALESALPAAAAPTLRFRIEHAQVIDPRDVPRLARLGLVASIQPSHATSDAGMTETRLGPERSAWAHAWRRLLDAGVPLACGSDFPVEPESPLRGLHAAVTRCRPDGTPAGGWQVDQALAAEEALRGYTVGAAWAAFREGEVGSLTPGRRADFVVLSGDPLAGPPGELAALRVVSTWIDGVRRWPET